MTKPVSPEVLAHYGVLGMKWGVRKDGKPQGYQGSKTKEVHSVDKRQRAMVKQQLSKPLSMGKNIAETQLANAITSSLGISNPVTVQLATIGTKHVLNNMSSYMDSGAPQAMKDRVTRKQWKTDESLKNAKSINDIANKVVKNVNPDYGSVGSVDNCRRATFAYELRRRGYDVSARKTLFASGQTDGGMAKALNKKSVISTHNLGQYRSLVREKAVSAITFGKAPTPLTDYRKGLKDRRISTTSRSEALVGKLSTQKAKSINAEVSRNIFKAMSGQPNGSRGEITLYWLSGGGHSIAYEIINNKPVFIDAQTGSIMTTPAMFEEKGYGAVSKSEYTRLDNVELNDKFLRRWVQ